MNTKDFINFDWYKDYNKFIKYLFSIQDLEYKKFHSSLGVNKSLIGIKTPILREIAKNIQKGDYKAFIEQNKHIYYEEVVIHGLILSYLKNYNEVINEFNKLLPYIDNWSSCDLICSSLKIIKKNLDITYPLVLSYLYDDNEWIKRVGIVILLSHYINDDYIDNIIIEISKINLKDYYVKTATAWLISVCYIKYPIKTIDFLRFNRIDNWTHNKAIQKIRESLRVSKEEKEKLNYLKR